MHNKKEAASEAATAQNLRQGLIETQYELIDAQEEEEHLTNQIVNARQMLAIEQRYFSVERMRNLELRKTDQQTKAMLVHQCWGHMENS